MPETTCLGAAIAAGIAKGVEVWDIESIQAVPSDTFQPSIPENSKIKSNIKGKCVTIRMNFFVL